MSSHSCKGIPTRPVSYERAVSLDGNNLSVFPPQSDLGKAVDSMASSLDKAAKSVSHDVANVTLNPMVSGRECV